MAFAAKEPAKATLPDAKQTAKAKLTTKDINDTLLRQALEELGEKVFTKHKNNEVNQ